MKEKRYALIREMPWSPYASSSTVAQSDSLSYIKKVMRENIAKNPDDEYILFDGADAVERRVPNRNSYVNNNAKADDYSDRVYRALSRYTTARVSMPYLDTYRAEFNDPKRTQNAIQKIGNGFPKADVKKTSATSFEVVVPHVMYNAKCRSCSVKTNFGGGIVLCSECGSDDLVKTGADDETEWFQCQKCGTIVSADRNETGIDRNGYATEVYTMNDNVPQCPKCDWYDSVLVNSEKSQWKCTRCGKKFIDEDYSDDEYEDMNWKPKKGIFGRFRR